MFLYFSVASSSSLRLLLFFFFFFNDTATTEIYTLSLHDALPIWCQPRSIRAKAPCPAQPAWTSVEASARGSTTIDRKSTRLNSSHQIISYAVFCLKKKKNNKIQHKQAWTQPRRRACGGPRCRQRS